MELHHVFFLMWLAHGLNGGKIEGISERFAVGNAVNHIILMI